MRTTQPHEDPVLRLVPLTPKNTKIELKIEVFHPLQTEQARDTPKPPLLAVKNQQSFLLITTAGFLTLFEDNKLVFSSKTKTENFHFWGAKYAKKLNAYLILNKGCVYRKDIDPKREYKWLKLKISGFSLCKSVLFSEAQNSLIVDDCEWYFKVIDFKTRKLKVKFFGRKEKNFVDLKLFGASDSQVACLTANGWLQLYSYAFLSQIHGNYKNFKIKFSACRNETACSLAVCNHNKYIMVELRRVNGTSSRLIMLEMTGKGKNLKIEPKVFFDSAGYSRGFRSSTVLSCYGYIGNGVYFVGLNMTHICLFGYDLEAYQLVELVKQRRKHTERRP